MARMRGLPPLISLSKLQTTVCRTMIPLLIRVTVSQKMSHSSQPLWQIKPLRKTRRRSHLTTLVLSKWGSTQVNPSNLSKYTTPRVEHPSSKDRTSLSRWRGQVKQASSPRQVSHQFISRYWKRLIASVLTASLQTSDFICPKNKCRFQDAK